MKLRHYALILFTAFGIHQAKAQTNTDPVRRSWGGSKGRLFSVKGIPYESQITGEAIASSPDWHFENPPPVDIATAAKTARRQLKELVDDEASWQIDEISLCRVTTAPRKWYYEIEFSKPNEERAKTIPLFVDFSGSSGKVWMETSLVTIWKNNSYEDTLAAIRLCDGVQVGSGLVIGGTSSDQSQGGVLWSFEGYDAVIAISTVAGKVSGMTYWTRKEFATSAATRAATGQLIIGATFYTKEKKVSINTAKQ